MYLCLLEIAVTIQAKNVKKLDQFLRRDDTLAVKMFGLGSLFMKKNAYVPEDGNEGGRAATPTSIQIWS